MAEHHSQIERQAPLHVGRQGQLVDGHLARCLVGDRHDVDADAAIDGQLGLGQRIAQVFIAVADDDDSLGVIGRKRGLRQLDGVGQVRIVGVELAFDLRLGDWSASSGGDSTSARGQRQSRRRDRRPCDAAAQPHSHTRSSPRSAGRNAERLIEQIENGQPSAGLHPLDFRRSEDEQQHHGGTEDQGRITAQRAERSQALATHKPYTAPGPAGPGTAGGRK